MRRLFHLVVVAAVLMCALHIGEPAKAHDGVDGHSAFLAHDADHASDDDGDEGGEPGKIAHASHHHCPIAPDQRAHADADSIAHGDAAVFAQPIAALKSRSQAPPVEPPLA